MGLGSEVQHIRMNVSHVVEEGVSRITYTAGHVYLVAKEFAEKLIADGKAVLHVAEKAVEGAESNAVKTGEDIEQAAHDLTRPLI